MSTQPYPVGTKVVVTWVPLSPTQKPPFTVGDIVEAGENFMEDGAVYFDKGHGERRTAVLDQQEIVGGAINGRWMHPIEWLRPLEDPDPIEIEETEEVTV